MSYTIETLPDYGLPTVELEGHTVPVLSHPDARILREIEQRGGRLYQDSWHTCQTAHCWAGWLMHLTGRQGVALLRGDLGYPIEADAARLIYEASAPGNHEPEFRTRDDANEEENTEYTYDEWDAHVLEMIRQRAAADPLPEGGRMMIGSYIDCRECDEILKRAECTRAQLWQIAEDLGWVRVGSIDHRCPRCVEDEAEEAGKEDSCASK